jgi:hypothetical protein
MYGTVQRTKWSPDDGQFLVEVDSLITEVVKEVLVRLKNEFATEVARVQHLVNQASHVEFSALVVTARQPAMALQLRGKMMHSMRQHVRSVLNERQLARMR